MNGHISEVPVLKTIFAFFSNIFDNLLTHRPLEEKCCLNDRFVFYILVLINANIHISIQRSVPMCSESNWTQMSKRLTQCTIKLVTSQNLWDNLLKTLNASCLPV